MSNPAQLPHMLRFGPFALDLRTAELYRDGERIKLQQQPYQILALLIQHPGELVTREELRKELWPNDTFVDFDHGVNIAINKLRDALGDSPEKPLFIETIPRRGYRFIAPVDTPKTSRYEEPPALATPVPAATGAPVEQPLRTTFPWRQVLLTVTLTVSLALVIILLSRHWPGHNGADRIRSIAVLPLENLSGDPAQEYFVDGMSDELTTHLAKISSLRVISRTSTMRYKKPRIPLAEIARSLHVDAVVEGSVLRSGDKVRITAQLIDARTDRHIWAEEYNRNLSDVIAVEGDVAWRIAQAVRAALTPEEHTRLIATPQVDPDAYEAYLKGRYFWNKRTPAEIKKAIAYFEESIAHDPHNPLAYDGLADCWHSLGWYGYLSPHETFPRTRAAARRALELDATLGEAYASLAMVSMNYDWDWPAAEREFRKAIELNPNYANAHHWYADYLSAVGRHEEAIAESKRAVELDPISPIINAWLGWRYFFARQYDRAIEQYLKTLEIDPTFAPAHLVLGQGYEQESQLEGAISELDQAVKFSQGSSLYVSSLAHAYAVAGKRSEAELLLHQLQDQSQKTYVAPFHFALVYTGLGQLDQAVGYLEKGYKERSSGMVWLKVDPRLDVLRSDPRFQDLLCRVGLAC